MLLTVVDQCLSLAIASANKRASAYAGGSMQARSAAWHMPLSHYPRLQAAMAKAEADGLLAKRRYLARTFN